ncbi:hypothetical protein Tsubulata_016996 [Turnera subulata]|uniref:Uncharacterized protein n=1 Tax=Turnera subulata TaxID=218843 RepID=A0A9Q0G8A5_9ROSI|nr:hypothetical protein Tsubulata_016996 [Turnera subulata]
MDHFARLFRISSFEDATVLEGQFSVRSAYAFLCFAVPALPRPLPWLRLDPAKYNFGSNCAGGGEFVGYLLAVWRLGCSIGWALPAVDKQSKHG